MANINSNPVFRFENGGTLELTVGGTTYTILNIKDGSLSFQPGMYERVNYKDRGVNQTPLEGDEMLGELECTIRCGAKQGADSLYAQLMTAGSSGLAKLFTILVAKWPAYRGASTGESATFSNPWLAEPPKFTAASGGQGLDELSFKMSFKTGPTMASY